MSRRHETALLLVPANGVRLSERIQSIRRSSVSDAAAPSPRRLTPGIRSLGLLATAAVVFAFYHHGAQFYVYFVDYGKDWASAANLTLPGSGPRFRSTS